MKNTWRKKFYWPKCRWKKGIDYFRIDGSTDIEDRIASIKDFNDYNNSQGRLFLISTKAGGIGINLIGANRCILFDACWNPSFDTQSIFRIYRIGQDRETFIYRFLSMGTMEEKIYKRQVTKIGLAQRVIDEHQLDRHFTSQELKELYMLEPDIWTGTHKNTPVLPKDDILRDLLRNFPQWIVSYHLHDSLLENKVNEGLSETERQLAWENYEKEKAPERKIQLVKSKPENEVCNHFDINGFGNENIQGVENNIVYPLSMQTFASSNALNVTTNRIDRAKNNIALKKSSTPSKNSKPNQKKTFSQVKRSEKENKEALTNSNLGNVFNFHALRETKEKYTQNLLQINTDEKEKEIIVISTP